MLSLLLVAPISNTGTSLDTCPIHNERVNQTDHYITNYIIVIAQVLVVGASLTFDLDHQWVKIRSWLLTGNFNSQLFNSEGLEYYTYNTVHEGEERSNDSFFHLVVRTLPSRTEGVHIVYEDDAGSHCLGLLKYAS